MARLLEPLVGKRALTLTELERRVLLAGDTPGAILRSTLAPGTVEGATVLVIEAKYQPVSGLLSFDNTLAQSLGRTTLGVGLDFNSIAGIGELVYLRASGHPAGGTNGFFNPYPTNRTLAAGFILPLWHDGLTFNAEFTDARTTPREILGVQTTSKFQRLSLRLRYNWLRGRNANSNSEVSFDAQDETQSLFVADVPVALSQDRLRILRFTHDGDVLTPWGGTIFGKVTGSIGLDALGARSAADATALLPLSRQGADARFQKIDITLGYLQSLFEHLSVHLTTRGQTSFGQALLRSEQIGIATTTGLSTFDAGTIVGDWGYVSRGEISSPWTLLLPNSPVDVVVSPYLFAAYGRVGLAQPTAVETAHIDATSYGAGVRFGGTVPGSLMNGSLTLEYGRATRSDAVPTADRFTIISATRF
jgi:hemolysin activation/secretion protein